MSQGGVAEKEGWRPGSRDLLPPNPGTCPQSSHPPSSLPTPRLWRGLQGGSHLQLSGPDQKNPGLDPAGPLFGTEPPYPVPGFSASQGAGPPCSGWVPNPNRLAPSLCHKRRSNLRSKCPWHLLETHSSHCSPKLGRKREGTAELQASRPPSLPCCPRILSPITLLPGAALPPHTSRGQTPGEHILP